MSKPTRGVSEVEDTILPRMSRSKVFGERHLRHLLRSYIHYYNGARTHLSLSKDAPIPRAVQVVGRIFFSQFLADCTINTFGFNFRQEQGWLRPMPWRRRGGSARKSIVARGDDQSIA